ncbi:hypothetical protein C731_1937 [Mycolicibacterium hassiacum DSM 44199]|uniref:Uncharacterized protein n=1 Tax=Mycolicibacterium hassiacum (strain DSM 44199 / CIP 105218 / JCM 12690 / 3849) TaxID=1122247 RepID=K5BFM7_MYCHD|nr:hypothetical protein [Mycolicibacterium hassiacum]EKF24052.1 hypothetical protein C731_1937 [Mycolicibacterium hassiacum DSM 44199]VCT90576.1 hypothetical protein MHAS_02285 [Mycolicibacterium hassiacum DSM 44199]
MAIRAGQERGEILKRREQLRKGDQHGSAQHDDTEYGKSRPSDFATLHELSGIGREGGIYAMTDNVDDDVFEEAIAEARNTGNLSRRTQMPRTRYPGGTQGLSRDQPPVACCLTGG